MPDIRCTIVTPERTVFDEQVDFVVIPGYDGEMGFLPRHTAFVSKLGGGELRVRNDNQWRYFFVAEGFVQVRANVITIVTGRAEASSEIDPATTEQELSAAQSMPRTDESASEARRKAIALAKSRIKIHRKSRAV